MSRDLSPFVLSLAECERDLVEFKQLLDSGYELSESRQILPFFRQHPHLAAMTASLNLQFDQIDRLGFELSLFGSFRCDLAVGDSRSRAFTLIEFEDARPSSIFGGGRRFNDEWGVRFEHGFSQLVDWFWALDHHRTVPDFTRCFGSMPVKFYGMLVIGRTRDLEPHHLERLHWRLEHVLVDSLKMTCITFDQLYEFVNERILALRAIAERGSLG